MEQSNDFKYRVAKALSCQTPPRDKLRVCNTPELVKDLGFTGDCIVMDQNKLRACLASEDTATAYENHHDLPIDFIDNLPKYIQNPAMVFSSMTHADNSIVIVTDRKDKKDCPIVIALSDNGRQGMVDGDVVKYTKLASAYGKNDFSAFLDRALQNNGLLFLDMKKSRDLAVSAGLQLPGVLADHDSDVIIRHYNDNVNSFKKKFLKNPKNYLPEKYGQTLYRADGLPAAYADADGRQRLIEYGKRADGSAFAVKTTVTLSDGSVETTEYNDRGRVTHLARKSADGRSSYTYSFDGYFRSSENSVEHYDGDDRSECKSVHARSREKSIERGYYYDHTKETWQDYDGRGDLVLSKQNLYGNKDRLIDANEVKYSYDRFGNRISETYDDGSVYMTEYYPPSEVRDHFNFDVDDYDAGAVDHNKVKTKTVRYSDGRVHITNYALDGKYSECEYASSGNLKSFRADNGETFFGKAAEVALLKSQGMLTTDADVKKSAAKAPTTKVKPAAANKAQKPTDKKTFCKGCKAKNSRGSGSGR